MVKALQGFIRIAGQRHDLELLTHFSGHDQAFDLTGQPQMLASATGLFEKVLNAQ